MNKLEQLKKKMEEAQAAWSEADAIRQNAETALYKAGVAWDNAEEAYEKELNKGKKEKIYNLDPAKLHAIKQEVVKEKIYNLDPAAFTPIFKGKAMNKLEQEIKLEDEIRELEKLLNIKIEQLQEFRK